MKRIVLIEDNEEIANLIIYLVARTSPTHIVTPYSSFEETIGQNWSIVDHCIVDNNLPGKKGSDVLNWLRDNHPNVKRIMFTASDPSDISSEIKQHSTVLYKPAGIDILKNALSL